MSNMQPIDPIDECVRLGRELARLQKEYKDTLDEAVAVETERNALKRENAALREALDQQANYQRELRADRDRLDWLGVGCSCDFSWIGKEAPPSSFTSLRNAIDWAMKEAQP